MHLTGEVDIDLVLAERLPEVAFHLVVHEHAAAVDSADGLEHREVGLNEDMLDAGVFAGLGQDMIQPLQMLAGDCAGDAAL